jgi:hypothetical protein
MEQEKSNTHKNENIVTHLLNSSNLTVKSILLVIFSYAIIFLIPSDGTFSINRYTAYAHFFG